MRNASLILTLLGILLASGCSKKNSADLTPKVAETPAPKSAPSAACEPTTVSELVAAVAKEETAKSGLDATAKNSPEKSNFRKLFDAEVAFVAATEGRLTRMKDCGADSATVTAVQTKLTNARANVTYLTESFPDFK